MNISLRKLLIKKLQKLNIRLKEVNKIGNEKNIIHKKIQLWTIDKGNELLSVNYLIQI